MRQDQFQVRVERRQQHALVKVGPVKRLPKLPGDGALRVVAVATQVAEVDATAQHQDRDEQRGKELPLWFTEPGHVFQDVVDNCHKPFTGSSGSRMRYPHLTSSWPHLLTPFAQKMSEVLPIEKAHFYILFFGREKIGSDTGKDEVSCIRLFLRP